MPMHGNATRQPVRAALVSAGWPGLHASFSVSALQPDIFSSTDSEALRFTDSKTPKNFRVPDLRLPETTPILNHPGREAHVPHPKWPTCIARPRFSGTNSGEKVYFDEVYALGLDP
jgi:hypothetical protein